MLCLGSVCEVNIDECLLPVELEMSPACLNNATCIDLINAYRCECSVGFIGDCYHRYHQHHHYLQQQRREL